MLFVTSADRPFTETERAFLETIRGWGKKIVIVINKIDIFERRDELDEVVAFVRASAQRLLGIDAGNLSGQRTPGAAREAGRAGAVGGQPLRGARAFIAETLDERAASG